MPNEQKLYKFQEDGVAWISSHRNNNYGFKADPLHGIIEDEMGLGKTAQALAAIEDSVKQGKRFLIIVPGQTMIQWQKQWDRWILDLEPDDWGTGQLVAMTGSKDDLPSGDSVVISHSLLARHDAVKKLAAANFDGIIIDEIHKFGSRGTRRIKNLWALINLSESKCDHARIGLTGTPTRNWAHEIYNIAHFVAPFCFRNFETFAAKYLTRDFKALWNPRQFHDDFAPFYIRRTVDEVQKDLPSHRRFKLYCEITNPLLRKIYNKNVDIMSNLMSSGRSLNQFSLLGYLQTLRHITGMAKAKEPAIIGPIIDYLDSDPVAEDQPRKVVLGIHHHNVSDHLRKSLRGYTTFLIRGGMDRWEKERVKLAFIRHPGPAILQLSIKAGGEGIDGLQECCQKSYVFERQWNGADELQFEKRISRTGQKHPTSTDYTIAVGTIDEFFDEMVEMKRRITNSVEDPNWESDPHFIRQLAERIISSPLNMNPATTRRIKEMNAVERSEDAAEADTEIEEIGEDDIGIDTDLVAQGMAEIDEATKVLNTEF